ncbi:WD40-repeat-containing domain protein [Triangularia verruculosa]|uniref:WD40-repeat-containing domain protein n=1 Tax=Triangularia verruculosa TaxID=2587418 RepID=A0AAN7AXC2_9PEZI|nr:WD40-repeat-containing domain protein [Triangularia verruculosa]
MSIPSSSRPRRNSAHPVPSRARGVSMSFATRQDSGLLALEDNSYEDFARLSLEKSRSHGFNSREHHHDGAPGSSKAPQQGNIKRMLRRASVSLKTNVKGFMHRRTSIPTATVFSTDNQDSKSPFLSSSPTNHDRPSTSHSTWHRLRQATSFHRHSRMLNTGHGERAFGHDLATIESPTFPIPGSGEQPPIIPRRTGAAARQAAAAVACSGRRGYEFMDFQRPHPSWLEDEYFGDGESGIGIAVTSSDSEGLLALGDLSLNADGDEKADIVKVDFISQLPAELAIMILAELDGPTLGVASLVNKHWAFVIKNQHVWRESFLREKTTTYATGGNVQPGSGLGVPFVHPKNDWKDIYRAKEQLDRNWKEGKARPVYLNGHTDSIYCLQFDEDKIITGSRDRTIRVWDMHTYACKLVIGPPEVVNDPTFSVIYDPSGNPIHYAHLPDLDPTPGPDGLPRATVRAHHSVPTILSPSMHHKASILCLQYDDEILVTGSSDATCIVYNIRSGYRPIRKLTHHSAAVLDLVFDDKHIVTCSKDISICVWDRATGALLKQLRGHSGPVNAVQMRGNTIVSCSGDFKVKLWNIDSGKNIQEFVGHTKGLACSQFSEDGRWIASAGNDKIIRIWDANTGECVREMKAHDNLVRSLHVDSISGRLVSGSYDSDIKVWDVETGQPLLDFPKWHSSWVLSAKSDYRRIVSSGQDPKILILDFGAGVEGVEMLESRRRVEEVVGGGEQEWL